jgi:hypothetical protein
VRLLPAVLLVVAVAGCSAGSSTPKPSAPSIAGVQVFSDLSHKHVAGPVVYPQHPPVGGPHWPPTAGGVLGWQRCGIYTEPVVDEFAVHSLEHGAVWLTYRPGLPAAAVTSLASLAGIRPAYVLVSPYPGQPAPVMATAWGLQLSVDSVDDPRLAEFTRGYAGGAQGQEPGADCAHGSTVEQAKAALADATAS